MEMWIGLAGKLGSARTMPDPTVPTIAVRERAKAARKAHWRASLERRRTGTYLTTMGSVLLPRVERLFAHIQTALCDPVIGASLSGRETTKSVENKITDTHIRALIAIAECGSFEAAARRLNISQPALHRSARDLERVVRRSLYQRMARGLAPTSQARELARRLKVALREVEYGVEEIRAAQGIFTSRITVGNIPHSGTYLLSK